MGHYTSIRFRALLNEAGKQILINLLGTHMHDRPWEGVAENARADGMAYSEALTAYAQLARSSFIPFGALSDDDWAGYFREIGNAGLELKRVLDGQSQWNVCCSLKNYDDEVDHFCKLLAHMIRSTCAVRIVNDDGLNECRLVRPIVHRTERERDDGAGAANAMALRAMLKAELADESDPFS